VSVFYGISVIKERSLGAGVISAKGELQLSVFLRYFRVL